MAHSKQEQAIPVKCPPSERYWALGWGMGTNERLSETGETPEEARSKLDKGITRARDVRVYDRWGGE